MRDGSIFMSSVIDKKSFDRNKSYIDYARNGADGASIIFGGECDDSKGYFIQPTLIQVTDVNSKLLKEVFLKYIHYVLRLGNFWPNRHCL